MIHYVTDRQRHPYTFWSVLEKALQSGIDVVQLREKNLSSAEFIAIARQVKKIVEKYRVPLLINDSVAVALAVDADGLHIGQQDIPAARAREILGPDKWIGLSISSVAELRLADVASVDYLGVGPVFETQTKSTTVQPLGLNELSRIKQLTTKPIIAIGGINFEDVSQVRQTGVDGVALSSAIRRRYETDHQPVVLSIAGSDSGAGAGIQADLKAISAHHAYAITAITALTAQNTQGVQAIVPVSAECVEAQIMSLGDDFDIKALKIGMLPSSAIIEVVARKINDYALSNIVLAPVMIATSGDLLTDRFSIEFLKEQLFSQASLITPNLFEAEYLLQCRLDTPKAIEVAAASLADYYECAVLIKGGHSKNTHECSDYFYSDSDQAWFTAPRVNTSNHHGTGCSLSAAIAAYLAWGFPLLESIRLAKHYVNQALKYAQHDCLGKGSGPIRHFYQHERQHVYR